MRWLLLSHCEIHCRYFPNAWMDTRRALRMFRDRRAAVDILGICRCERSGADTLQKSQGVSTPLDRAVRLYEDCRFVIACENSDADELTDAAYKQVGSKNRRRTWQRHEGSADPEWCFQVTEGLVRSFAFALFRLVAASACAVLFLLVSHAHARPAEAN